MLKILNNERAKYFLLGKIVLDEIFWKNRYLCRSFFFF